MALNVEALVKAVSCWLEYEAAIGHERLFDESYLAYPVGAFLQVHGNGSVRPEEQHPLLTTGVQGKPPAVDYVLTPLGANEPWTTALELKFISKDRDLSAELFKDILRLEVIVEKYPAAARILMVAGKSQYLREQLKDRAGNTGTGAPTPLFPSVLSIDSQVPRLTLNLQQSVEPHRGYWRDAKPEILPGWPSSLVTTCIGAYGDMSKDDVYACFAWEIASLPRPVIQL